MSWLLVGCSKVKNWLFVVCSLFIYFLFLFKCGLVNFCIVFYFLCLILCKLSSLCFCVLCFITFKCSGVCCYMKLFCMLHSFFFFYVSISINSFCVNTLNLGDQYLSYNNYDNLWVRIIKKRFVGFLNLIYLLCIIQYIYTSGCIRNHRLSFEA